MYNVLSEPCSGIVVNMPPSSHKANRPVILSIIDLIKAHKRIGAGSSGFIYLSQEMADRFQAESGCKLPMKINDFNLRVEPCQSVQMMALNT